MDLCVSYSHTHCSDRNQYPSPSAYHPWSYRYTHDTRTHQSWQCDSSFFVFYLIDIADPVIHKELIYSIPQWCKSSTPHKYPYDIWVFSRSPYEFWSCESSYDQCINHNTIHQYRCKCMPSFGVHECSYGRWFIIDTR